MWHFKCDTYNGEELFKIFELQLEKENLKISLKDRLKIQDYIKDNVHAFLNYGGDCARLCFFVQLSMASNDKDNNYVTLKDVKKGIDSLMLNNVDKKGPDNKNDLMKEFARRFGNLN